MKYEHVWSNGVYRECLLKYMYIHRHKTCPLCMYNNIVNRGALERCYKMYPKLDGDLICYVPINGLLT